MRAVRNTESGIAVVEVDEPARDRFGEEGVVLDVVSSSICGTDVGLVAGGATGFTFGHEFAGTVGGVTYAVEPAFWCGRCDQCLAGHTQRCQGERGNLGIFTDGGLADQVVVPEASLVRLPDGLAPEAACLVEPAAVAWHGMRVAAIEPGARVVVVGGGSIGLLAVAAVRAAGREVALSARHPHQLEAGERLGATTDVSGQYDVVIEAAGTDSVIGTCAQLAAPGGRIVLLGVFHGPVPVPGIDTLVKELTWTAAMAYGRHDDIREVDEAAALLAADPDIAATVITHRFPLEAAAEAFRVASDRSSGSIKVVLSP